MNKYPEYELDDLVEWVNESPVLIGRSETLSENVLAPLEPFSQFGASHHKSLDVESALASMSHEGGDNGIHQTHLKVTGAIDSFHN